MKFKKGDKVKLTWASHDKAKNKAQGTVIDYDKKFKQYNVEVDGKVSKFNEDEMIKESKIQYKDFFLEADQHKIYVKKGQSAPEGKKVQTGPRGGQYFVGTAKEKEEFGKSNKEKDKYFKQVGAEIDKEDDKKYDPTLDPDYQDQEKEFEKSRKSFSKDKAINTELSRLSQMPNSTVEGNKVIRKVTADDFDDEYIKDYIKQYGGDVITYEPAEPTGIYPGKPDEEIRIELLTKDGKRIFAQGFDPNSNKNGSMTTSLMGKAPEPKQPKKPIKKLNAKQQQSKLETSISNADWLKSAYEGDYKNKQQAYELVQDIVDNAGIDEYEEDDEARDKALSYVNQQLIKQAKKQAGVKFPKIF